jgi:hypothetical protein
MTAQPSLPDPIPMSLDDFVQTVRSLPPEKIADIPVEQLPENLPANLAEQFPVVTRGAVENLLLAANSYHLSRRLDDENRYGREIVGALDKARFSGDTASIRVFKDKILNMVTMLQEYQRNPKKHNIALFVNNIEHINDLLIDVRSEQVAVFKARRPLEDIRPDTETDRARFAEAIAQLDKQGEYIDVLLGEYYILRLKIMSRSISEKRRQVEAQEQATADLPRQIADLRKQLDQSQSVWRRTLNRGKALEETKELQDRITELVQEMNANEVVISENDLTLWLDTIVDASLNDHCRGRIERPARDARISLYYLLNTFCRKQEDSALQIAQNPFLRVEPEKAIRYVLMSEQFILSYFANKKKDTTAWLSGAAQAKIGELDLLEKDILSELRRSTKKRLRKARSLF